ncbi:MAG: RNA methyltransferase [Chloroflexi bacterium]|nr:MAG: RNA methyltransferase [Chloroflexota bacterium]
MRNEKVKLARALLSSKGRTRQKLFLIEGLRIIREAIGAGVKPRFVFYTEAFKGKGEGSLLLETLLAEGVPCYAVSQAIMRSISSTVTPQGIVAIIPFPKFTLPEEGWMTVILDGLQNPDNLGAILRTAAAAGVDGVITTFGSVDVYNPKAVRAAMGAHFHIPIRTGLHWHQITPFLKGKQIILADVNGPAAYYEVDWTSPSALVLGNEAKGAREEARSLAHQVVSIPMIGNIESLNVAVAAGIIIYEALRQRTLKNT